LPRLRVAGGLRKDVLARRFLPFFSLVIKSSSIASSRNPGKLGALILPSEIEARLLFSLSPVRRLNLKVECNRVADLHRRGLKETKFNVTGTEVGGHVVKMRLYPQLTEMRIRTKG